MSWALGSGWKAVGEGSGQNLEVGVKSSFIYLFLKAAKQEKANPLNTMFQKSGSENLSMVTDLLHGSQPALCMGTGTVVETIRM